MHTLRSTLPAALLAGAVLTLPTALTAGLASSATAAEIPAGTTPAAAPTNAPKPAYKVTMKANAKEAIRSETEIKFKGRVFGAAKGKEVQLQIRYEGKNRWKTVKESAKVKANRTYVLTDSPTTERDRTYRVRVVGDAKRSVGYSREREVNVWSWDYLGAAEPSAVSGVESAYGLPINGESQQLSVYLVKTNPTGFVEYTLGRHCRSVRTTLGLSDRTETGGRATIKVTGDGADFFTKEYALGQSDVLQFDTDNVYRLRVDFAQTANTPVTEPAAGSLMALCD